MTVELCTLCGERPATTTWGFPVCDDCHGFLGRLDVDLKAMEDADPELAAIAGRVTGWPVGFDPRSYSDRAREAIAARRKETALPDPATPFRVGDRVRRRDHHTTASDGTEHAPTGTIEATHYSHARPTVDVYWGTRPGGHSGDEPVRVATTEAPETLEPTT